MPKVNDFFCGCGGMGLGFKKAGYEIVGAWDFDKYAVQSYRENVGDHVRQADITKMDWLNVPKADVWTFGFPCQDLSIAGKQVGLFEGKRSGLFFEIMRLLDETIQNDVDSLPKVLLAENVKGLKPYLPVLESEYAKLGYKMHVKLLNSKYWGVPQSRERYFVVGVRDGSHFNFPEEVKTGIPKLSSILEADIDEKYYISDEKATKVIEEAMKKVELKGTHACLTPDRPKRQNGPRAKAEEEPMFTLNTQDRHGVIQSIVGRQSEPKIIVTGVYGQKGGFVPQDISNTLDASAFKGLGCNQARPAVAEIYPRYRVRKLTPREYARLQAFRDDYKFVVSNSQLYKQFGNAVTVNVAEAMALAIRDQLLDEHH